MKYKSLVIEFSYMEIVAVYIKEQETVKVTIGGEIFWRHRTSKAWFTRENVKEWLVLELLSRVETQGKQLDQIRQISYNEEY